MAHAQPKDSLINIRAQSAQRALIDKAANLLHKNRSDFILEIACREAENVLLDRTLFLLNEDDFNRFNTLLETDLDNNHGLIDLLERKAPWER